MFLLWCHVITVSRTRSCHFWRYRRTTYGKQTSLTIDHQTHILIRMYVHGVKAHIGTLMEGHVNICMRKIPSYAAILHVMTTTDFQASIVTTHIIVVWCEIHVIDWWAVVWLVSGITSKTVLGFLPGSWFWCDPTSRNHWLRQFWDFSLGLAITCQARNCCMI